MLILLGNIGITREAGTSKHKTGTPLGFLKNATGQRPAPRLQNMLRLRGKIGIAREAGTSKHKAATPLGFLKNRWPWASSQTSKHVEITWKNWNHKRSSQTTKLIDYLAKSELQEKLEPRNTKLEPLLGFLKNSWPKANS